MYCKCLKKLQNTSLTAVSLHCKSQCLILWLLSQTKVQSEVSSTLLLLFLHEKFYAVGDCCIVMKQKWGYPSPLVICCNFPPQVHWWTSANSWSWARTWRQETPSEGVYRTDSKDPWFISTETWTGLPPLQQSCGWWLAWCVRAVRWETTDRKKQYNVHLCDPSEAISNFCSYGT